MLRFFGILNISLIVEASVFDEGRHDATLESNATPLDSNDANSEKFIRSPNGIRQVSQSVSWQIEDPNAGQRVFFFLLSFHPSPFLSTGSMLLLFLLSSLLLFSPVSTGRTYPNKCEVCIEMVAYIIQEIETWGDSQTLSKDIMMGLEVYCFHHVGGREATCSDFTNMIRKGDIFKILWDSTKKCRDSMLKIEGTRRNKLHWGCPTAPDCICLNLQQCDGLKHDVVQRSQHAECDDLDSFELERFTDVFKKINYTAYDSEIL